MDNLCWIYDNNHITIEGNTRIAFTEDIAARFMGYGWNVLRVGDANDIDRIEQALDIFHKTKGRPTFIILDSHIGYGSPHKQDTAAAHGEPLGEEESSPHQTRLRMARGRQVPGSRTPCASTSPPESARAARKPMNAGPSCSRLTGRNIRSSRPRST